MANWWGNNGNSSRLYFGVSEITADCDCHHVIKRCLLLGRKAMTNLYSMSKSRDTTLPTKVHLGKAMFYSSRHVWIWDLDYKDSWASKNGCFWTVVLEKTLESHLDCKMIQPVHPKGNQSWVFFRRAYVEAETPILWPPDAKNWLIGKDPDAAKDWRWEEKGATEDEMVGWHHRLSGYDFEQTLRVGDGQRSMVYCSPWGHKEWDTTERLNWTELNIAISHSEIQYLSPWV